jgi:hypothetical protein
MNVEHEIKQALTLLEPALSELQQPPAVVALPPDSSQFLIGNQGGFIHLAVASLKAAQGTAQSFKKVPWFVAYELDWSLSGLKPDENAHTYLPAKLTRAQRVIRSSAGLLVVLLAALSILVGFVTIVRWIVHVL